MPHFTYDYYKKPGKYLDTVNILAEGFKSHIEVTDGCGMGCIPLIKAEYDLETGNFDQVLLNGYEQGGGYDEYTYWVTDFGQFPNECYTIKNNRAQDAADVLVICDSIFMRGFPICPCAVDL